MANFEKNAVFWASDIGPCGQGPVLVPQLSGRVLVSKGFMASYATHSSEKEGHRQPKVSLLGSWLGMLLLTVHSPRLYSSHWEGRVRGPRSS